MITDQIIKNKLESVFYPGFNRNIISFGLVKNIKVDANNVFIKIILETKDYSIPKKIKEDINSKLKEIDCIGNIEVDFDIKDPPSNFSQNDSILSKKGIPGVKKIIAVASGKGGVGKSTISTNLAIALKNTGANVGICDCDLYGPSTALMLGVENEDIMATHDNKIIPVNAHGIKVLSMAFLLDDNSPVIIRGALATRYIQQFLTDCQWGDLDYLILDLPPGTGDIQLTIVQTISVDSSIIVTTPQEVSLIDARKAIEMFKKVKVPITGIIENMSWFECNHNDKHFIFGEGGAKLEAEKLDISIFEQIPLEVKIRECSDKGSPVALLDENNSNGSGIFNKVAKKLVKEISK